jgi:uncharacterized phage protein (TIGR01671 family)
VREIKFRLWNANARIMEEKATTVAIAIGSGEIESTTGETHVAMQYTGLKDKNGKEICEGDILRGSFGIPPISVTGPVFFKDGAFYVDTKGHKPAECLLSEAIELLDAEVIGNQHEDPELLND